MIKILAVDDEREFTEMIRSYFEPRGYEVFVAHNGDLALEIAKREQPDIALLDLKMPGKHGDQVLVELKTISPATKSIMITASEGDGKIREQLIDLGALYCFDKPVESLRALESCIKEAVGKNECRA